MSRFTGTRDIQGGGHMHGEDVGCLSLDLNTWPALNPVPHQLRPVCFIPVWTICSTLVMRNRALDGYLAISRQIVKAGLPFLETRYDSPSLPQESGHHSESFLSCTILTYCYFTGNGETGYLPVQRPCDDEWDPYTSTAGWGPDSR